MLFCTLQQQPLISIFRPQPVIRYNKRIYIFVCHKNIALHRLHQHTSISTERFSARALYRGTPSCTLLLLIHRNISTGNAFARTKKMVNSSCPQVNVGRKVLVVGGTHEGMRGVLTKKNFALSRIRPEGAVSALDYKLVSNAFIEEIQPTPLDIKRVVPVYGRKVHDELDEWLPDLLRGVATAVARSTRVDDKHLEEYADMFKQMVRSKRKRNATVSHSDHEED